MKKHKVRRTHHHHATVKRVSTDENYLVVVRGWMLVIAFALMLGVGVIVGDFVNKQLNLQAPAVAGVSTEAR